MQPAIRVSGNATKLKSSNPNLEHSEAVDENAHYTNRSDQRRFLPPLSVHRQHRIHVSDHVHDLLFYWGSGKDYNSNNKID